MFCVARRRALTGAAGWFALNLALPGRVAARTDPDWQVVGRGVFRAFGFHVYDAVLRAGRSFAPRSYERHELELELTYARAFRGSAIAERSLREMRRVGRFTDTDGERWLRWMNSALPDVQPGDRLAGWYAPREGIRFVHNGRPIAQSDDTEFARLFIGIWLSPQTSAPDLRRQLLRLDDA